MHLTITGFSTALFSTWYFIEELNLLFDCGDGLMAGLLQKSRKIDHVFISHADRDHLSGLLQFNQLNAREGFPIIHYPKDCGSFGALESFTQKFDPHAKGTLWQPVIDKEIIWIKKDIYVQAIRNNHVATTPDKHKSLGYKVVQVKSKLKHQYSQLKPLEIKALIEHQSKEATHETVESILIAYSGDTPCENFEHWNNAKVLIHEATFIDYIIDSNTKVNRNKHSKLEDVIRSASEIKLGSLILGHFSSRYSDSEIDTKIKEYINTYKLETPVYRLLPGQVVRDVLRLNNPL
jgi:ribonuclease Z